MQATIDRPFHSNPLEIATLFRWLTIAALLGVCGFLFVRVKIQQHALGEKISRVEKQILEERSRNEGLLTRISTLSSWKELRRKVDSGRLGVMHPIRENAVARLTPATEAPADRIARTASREHALR